MIFHSIRQEGRLIKFWFLPARWMRMTHQSALAMKVTTEFDVDHFCFLWHATQQSLFWILDFLRAYLQNFVKLYAYVEALLLLTIAIPIPITITRWKNFDDHENKALLSKLLWNSSITVLEVLCVSIMIQNALFHSNGNFAID